SIRIPIVLGNHSLHPSRSSFSIGFVAVFFEKLDFTASHRHIDDADLDTVRKDFSQSFSEIIPGSKTGIAATKGGNGWIPIPFLSIQICTIHCLQNFKPLI